MVFFLEPLWSEFCGQFFIAMQWRLTAQGGLRKAAGCRGRRSDAAVASSSSPDRNGAL